MAVIISLTSIWFYHKKIRAAKQNNKKKKEAKKVNISDIVSYISTDDSLEHSDNIITYNDTDVAIVQEHEDNGLPIFYKISNISGK